MWMVFRYDRGLGGGFDGARVIDGAGVDADVERVSRVPRSAGGVVTSRLRYVDTRLPWIECY
jgi:hypothetical protein